MKANVAKITKLPVLSSYVKLVSLCMVVLVYLDENEQYYRYTLRWYYEPLSKLTYFHSGSTMHGWIQITKYFLGISQAELRGTTMFLALLCFLEEESCSTIYRSRLNCRYYKYNCHQTSGRTEDRNVARIKFHLACEHALKPNREPASMTNEF